MQISLIVLSRDIFVSRDIISKIAMWMGSLSRKVCCNAHCETENFLHNTDYEWEGQELKPVALQGRPCTFGSRYMMIRLFLSREVNWLHWWWEIACWIRIFLPIPLIASSSFINTVYYEYLIELCSLLNNNLLCLTWLPLIHCQDG